MTEVRQNTVESVFIKEHLTNQIDNLKNDIQDLLDRKKSLTDKNDIAKCLEEKQKKMDTLKVLNDKLKEICKRERLEVQKRNELRSITRAIDSIDFGAAKKKNTAEAMDKAKRAKAQRDDTRIKYMEYQQMEQSYIEHDIETLPGCLFLSKDVLKSYGLCPYIDISSDGEIISKETLKGNRMEWLQSKDDGGELYYNLYKALFEKQDLDKVIDEKKKLQDEIDIYIMSLLTDDQKEMYIDSKNFIKEYIGCHIKTKRIKERFKVMINTLSVLFSETAIEIHNYLSAYYDLPIVVNILDSKRQLTNFDKLQRSIYVERFQDYLKKYTDMLQKVDQTEKYTINTVKNLRMDLYQYLTDRQNFLTKHDIQEVKKLRVKQEGKYFKKWSSLNDEERLERFHSYSVFYVDKNLVETKLIDKTLRDDNVKKLYELLSTAFTNKTLVYRNITWNVKKGFIETVKILRYDNDNTFCLDIDKKTKTSSEENTKDDTSTKGDTKDVERKKISSRTILTKETEKIINEEMLYFILKRVQNGVTQSSKEDKEAFSERIKTKLKIKKITSNDKTKIFEKYDEILDVVNNNS